MEYHVAEKDIELTGSLCSMYLLSAHTHIYTCIAYSHSCIWVNMLRAHAHIYVRLSITAHAYMCDWNGLGWCLRPRASPVTHGMLDQLSLSHVTKEIRDTYLLNNMSYVNSTIHELIHYTAVLGVIFVIHYFGDGVNWEM